MVIINETSVESIYYNATNRPTELEKHGVIKFVNDFIVDNPSNKENIRKSLEYATKERMSFGGFVIVQKWFGEIVGVSIVNHTGMEGYMPENILTYIAVSDHHKKNGIAKEMIQQVLNYAKGEVAVYLRDRNDLIPAFEHLGFKKTIEGMIIVR